MSEISSIPKKRLTRRGAVVYGGAASLLAAAGVLGARACLPPEPPLDAAMHDLSELGCASGGVVLGITLDDPEVSWGYDCVAIDRAHAPDCDAVAAHWAKSAKGLQPFEIVVHAGNPQDAALCRRRYDGHGVVEADTLEHVDRGTGGSGE